MVSTGKELSLMILQWTWDKPKGADKWSVVALCFEDGVHWKSKGKSGGFVAPQVVLESCGLLLE